jgi:hypothetical protein
MLEDGAKDLSHIRLAQQIGSAEESRPISSPRSWLRTRGTRGTGRYRQSAWAIDGGGGQLVERLAHVGSSLPSSEHLGVGL